MQMPKKPIDGVKKQTYQVTLNPENVRILREQRGVDNLSGWLNDKVREEVYTRFVWGCKSCDAAASPNVWHKWKNICPNCKAVHLDGEFRNKTTNVELKGDVVA